MLLGSTILIPLITLIGKMHLRKKYSFELEKHSIANKPSSVDLKEPKLGAEEEQELAEALKTNENLKRINRFIQNFNCTAYSKLESLIVLKLMKGKFLLSSLNDLKYLPGYVQISFKAQNIEDFTNANQRCRVIHVDFSGANVGADVPKRLPLC